MDPAGVGALIGISIMIGGLSVYLLYEKCQTWKKNRPQIVIVPVSVKNPLLKKHHSSMRKLFVQNG